jgi:hypothetical protein
MYSLHQLLPTLSLTLCKLVLAVNVSPKTYDVKPPSAVHFSSGKACLAATKMVFLKLHWLFPTYCLLLSTNHVLAVNVQRKTYYVKPVLAVPTAFCLLPAHFSLPAAPLNW